MAQIRPMAHTVASVTLGAQGRVAIPAPIRKALDFLPGERLLVRVEGDHLIVEKTNAVERRVHARFRKAAGRSLADGLIEQRHRDAADSDEAR